MNYFQSNKTSALSTNRTVLSYLNPFFPKQAANDLNIIINQADGKTTTAKDMNSFFRTPKTCKRINDELARRNLDYRVSKIFCTSSLPLFLLIPAFIAMNQMMTALNILSADYNERG